MRVTILSLLIGVPWSAAAGVDALAPLSRKWLETGGPAAREALIQFAAEHKSQPEGALARLVLGIGDYQDKKLPSALEQLALVPEDSTEFPDYAVYYHALASASTGDHSGAVRLLTGFGKRFPSSPLVAAANRQRIDSLSLSSRAREALALLTATPRTASDWMMLAQVAERAGEPVRAAQAYQHVYYEFPASAEQAQVAIRALRTSLGSRYPAPSAALRLTRADRLAGTKQFVMARSEYRSLSVSLKGLPREQAAVRIGVCDYNLKANLRAYKWLKALKLTQPEASAERLFYLAACARRLNRGGEFIHVVTQLGREHRTSPWNEEALFSAGNYYLLENDKDRYIPYYRSIYEIFPEGKYAATAHWKVTWCAYLDRNGAEKEADARQLLEDHVRLYPASQDATAAVYWLARMAEASEDRLTARAIYTHLTTNYPYYYHSLLAERRLSNLAPGPSGPVSPAVERLLTALPAAPKPPTPEPPEEVTSLLRRARLLARLGLVELADRELRFRAESNRLAYYAGSELAQRAADGGYHHQAIRFLKRYTPGYLAFPIESLPRQYWELLFPLPWRQEIESYSQLRELDPYLVAALIRQESEFNPGAVSRAKARGLMQIVLPTGRKLGRTVGMPRISANSLHVPETSLRLGILHLRSVLDQYDGKVELALAGYNAGEHRVDKWMGRYSKEDTAEFVESIPFTETRTYVQAVLRNAQIYRKLYGS